MFDGLLKDDLEQKTPTKYGFAKGWYGRKPSSPRAREASAKTMLVASVQGLFVTWRAGSVAALRRTAVLAIATSPVMT